jgi:hypothetical protein
MNTNLKYSKLYIYVESLSKMLVEIAELEEKLDICMSTGSKEAFKKDVETMKQLASMRIQSTKSKNYIAFICLYGKIENYLFILRRKLHSINKLENL